MCGRYQTPLDIKKIEEAFDIKIDKKLYKTNYNAAPGQVLPLITNNIPDQLQYFRWGLVPHWSKDEAIGYKMINARIETLKEKPSFKSLVDAKRCAVITSGYYEWQKNDSKTKTPMRIYLNDEKIFTFAGLWTEWKNPDGQIIPTFTIITTEAYSAIKNIHERMPVMLSPEIARQWIINEIELEQLQKEMISQKEIHFHAVSTDVNSYRNNYKELLDRV